MYRNIDLQAFRNLMEFRISHKIDLGVGSKIDLLKSRLDFETNQEVYSLTTNCEVTSINPTRIPSYLNLTIKPENQEPLYLDYRNGLATISDSKKYRFTTYVLQLPDEVDFNRILKGKLYYIQISMSMFTCGIKKTREIEMPVFGYDEQDAFEVLKSNTETSLSLGEGRYRVVDMFNNSININKLEE